MLHKCELRLTEALNPCFTHMRNPGRVLDIEPGAWAWLIDPGLAVLTEPTGICIEPGRFIGPREPVGICIEPPGIDPILAEPTEPTGIDVEPPPCIEPPCVELPGPGI